MNKLEANVSLLIITFFAAIQYIFLSAIPDTVSHFAFLCITNLIGFLITLAFFFGELFRLDKKQIVQSMALAGELFVFNVFLLLGSSGVSATVCACVLSAYFVFIPLFSVLIFHQKTEINNYVGIVIVLTGLFLILGTDVTGIFNRNVLYLLVADATFALYIMTSGKFSIGSNPSILAMGQMFFTFLFSLLFWAGESVVLHKPMSLPTDASFWGSVIYISFFIRGLYGIVQIYALRYVSPLNTSLIFSSEIIMTMFMSPILTLVFGSDPEQITLLKAAGGVVMVMGILAADSSVVESIKRRFVRVEK